ncbi:hypothetical protein KIW84_010486 [Lathyrus oleraceus]|uniref:Aminotransferase-like plant mobile domain-containing protein n=1 Tax=Pisum sativum TaxID=3888 RepID=A0A9D4YLC9_PEA|nr:hypothetical protein KIW84_010486 [Pisum sativum]
MPMYQILPWKREVEKSGIALHSSVPCLLSIRVAKTYMPITTQLHEGKRICMSRLILMGLYESLALEVADIVRPENPNSIQIGGHVWLLQLWLIATFESSPKTKIPPNPTTSIKGS